MLYQNSINPYKEYIKIINLIKGGDGKTQLKNDQKIQWIWNRGVFHNRKRKRKERMR